MAQSSRDTVSGIMAAIRGLHVAEATKNVSESKLPLLKRDRANATARSQPPDVDETIRSQFMAILKRLVALTCSN